MTIISHLSKYQNNLILLRQHLEDGTMKEKLDVLDQIQGHAVGKDYITSKMLKNSLVFNQLYKNRHYVTPELVPIIKKKILKDKSNYLNHNIQMLNTLKILQVGSIGIDQDLNPYWSSSTKELSKQLLFPIKTDFVDLDLNSLNGYSINTMLNSWFSIKIMKYAVPQTNCQMTYLQSLLFLLQDTMVKERLILESKEEIKKQKKEQKQTKTNNEKIEINVKEKITKDEIKTKAGKAKRIRIYPTLEQRKILKKWFGCSRYIYNKGLEYFNNVYTNEKREPNIKELRDKIINKHNYTNDNEWLKEYDYDLKDEALRDLLKNIKSNKAKGGFFKIKYKSKKLNIDSINVLSKKWNKKGFYSEIFSKTKIKCNKSDNDLIPEKLMYTSRLIKDRINNYYLTIPQPLEISDNQANDKIIFIDPGQSTFITGYDPSGHVITIGKCDIGRIGRLLHYKNKFQKRMDLESNTYKKYKMSIALLRMNRKIQNLVNDYHKKTTKFLTSNYNYIFIPKLNFHTCKKLNKKNKQKLASLRHCDLVDRLINKSREIRNCKVEIVNEAWTSKTCSNCGTCKDALSKTTRIYDCYNCGLSTDRDVNGSINIMLRYFTKRVSVNTLTLGPIPAN